MVMMCSTPISPKISFDVLKDHALQDVSRYTKNTQRGLNRIQQWYDDPGNYEFKALNGLEAVSRNLPFVRIVKSRASDNFQISTAAFDFVADYASNLTALDASRKGSVGMYPTGFAIIDNLAAGRMNNAQTLRDQSVQLLNNRDYSEQQSYAEDKERMRDPENCVWIIPQRIFVFAHELMGQREGQAKQPWDHWDVIGDDDYIAAARAVYTKDIGEAAQVVCKLCNLHVEYSNPFPEGDNDDHLVGIEFDTPVRTLWPTEIFAWLCLRHERGLPLPVVDHPLLSQPLGQFDPAAKPVADHEPWFTELVNKLATFQPRYASLPEMVFGNP